MAVKEAYHWLFNIKKIMNIYIYIYIYIYICVCVCV